MGNRSSLDDIGIVCNCGHEESEHSFAGFCNVLIPTDDNTDAQFKCGCDHYSQTKLRNRNDAKSN